MKHLLFIVLVAACGGSSTKAPSTPTAPAPSPAAPAPVADNRCTAPQVWLKPGCGAPNAYTEGCQTRCDKPGATPEERADPSKCGAGTTCQKVDYWPDDGAGEACGSEVYLCLPAA